MQRNSSSMGAFHPTLFLMVIFAIALALTFFVGRMVLSVINSNDITDSEVSSKVQNSITLK